jgi:hypothetical protein
MEAEDNWGVDKAMNEKDLEYLSNINTSPGPNAGRSIDPTKPGPDADAAIRQEPKMTDEERRRMVDDLRRRKSSWLEDVADEIERLAEELQYQYACDKAQQEEIKRLSALAQSDAEPVAWRYAYPLYPDEWNLTQDQLTAEERMRKESCVVEPLYAGPPRPDDADKPLGFRTNDVPNPYAEGPQSDARPLAWHWNSKLEGWTYTSDAGPVAWQRLAEYISGKSRWITGNEEMAKEAAARGMKVRPLYVAPPRPDASAGLIEAAGMADEEAAKTGDLEGWELMKFAKLLRARATDRSGK